MNLHPWLIPIVVYIAIACPFFFILSKWIIKWTGRQPIPMTSIWQLLLTIASTMSIVMGYQYSGEKSGWLAFFVLFTAAVIEKLLQCVVGKRMPEPALRAHSSS